MLYVLAQAVSKEADADSEAAYQRLLERILKLQPNNLRVLAQHAMSAWRRKDQAAFQASLGRMKKLAPAWTPASKEVLAELEKAIAAVPGEVVPLLQDLDRVLKAERGYVRDSRAIVPQLGIIGEPLYAFLRLEPARATPAPPDRALTFAVEPIDGADEASWQTLVPVWMINEKQRAALVEEAIEGGVAAGPLATLRPTFFVANAKEVRRVDAGAPRLPFPAGPKATPPTKDGVLAVDWDNDFRTDLVLAGAGGLRFWRQSSEGFVDVTDKTGLPPDILNGDYHGAWAADVEMDGDLDIVVARRSGPPLLLRNNRDGTFKALEPFAGVKDVRAFVWIDLDNDGAPDAVFLDAAGALHVFANERSGQFAPWPSAAPAGLFRAVAAGAIHDDDGFALVLLRSDGALISVADQDKRQAWRTRELARSDLAKPDASVRLFVEDIDNNGALDIVVATDTASGLFLADGKGTWSALPADTKIKTFALLDLNGDGRLDLVGLSEKGRPERGMQDGKKSYRWQSLWPLANPKAGDDRINSFAVGGEVEIRSGLLVQKRAIRGLGVHFGLGEHDEVDVARIVWPNGVPQWEFDTRADVFLTASQRLTGSCPFLFTWDGAGVRFAGDFMWGTPLGMYVNGQNIGEFPQTTEWLKISGEALKPRDGAYDVRVHANLWETDFLDQLALIVVDHPPDTEIHVDERFFLTPTPPRFYLTTPVQPVPHAWDHHGGDVTELVRAVDGRYVDKCGRGRFQGVVPEHWIEVDLGEEACEGPLLLVARGWLHPTNTSINVALDQGKHEAPRPLCLDIPDGKGGWKTVLPALGFPAGKDKTMVIRLDGIEGEAGGARPRIAPRRFRLRTTMEIFWDFLGTARELDPKLARLQRPTPAAAELRYRGILEMTRKDASSPELPNYDKVNVAGQPWRDLTGFYTRFGDVRELVAKVDDRYVIMNAGDEIAFRFPAPASPPSGWKRDFIWECDGWTRDGDLNTRFGATVLPLPAHGVKEERLPTRLEDDPVFRRFPADWRDYHTRFVTSDVFARGLRAFKR
ncbi:MAG: CRTAC1 family protein [Gemmataceae bacterium]